MGHFKSGLSALTIGFITLATGVTLPQCPGQQAMQQQLDSVQAAQVDLSKKLQSLDAQLKSLSADMTQVKEILPQATNVLKQQRETLDQLQVSLKALETQVTKALPAKKRGR